MKKLLTTATLIAALAGCSSILSDSSYNVRLSSNPQQMEYKVIDKDGAVVASGQTPTVLNLDASSGYFSGAKYKVEITGAGYNKQTIMINASLDGWYFGNILFGGLIGMLIVDPATGSMWKLPDQAFAEASPKLTIKHIDELSPDQLAMLEKL